MSAVAVTAGYVTDEHQGSDLRAVAKELASRKVLRFLDGASLAPFIAAANAYQRSTVRPDPADVALYTVSGWDGAQPDPPFVPDGSPADDARLGLHILEDANPTGRLRMLANNALCQVSIVAGFRGPNAHLVGDAEALWQVLVTAGANLRSGAAGLVLVVAYDPPAEQLGNPSERTQSRAGALALAVGDGADALPALLDSVYAAARSGTGALAALRECLAHTDLPVAAGDRQ